MSGFFAGAVMTTFFAPAARCLAASSRLVNSPVDSKTTSTPRSFHGSCAGSRSDSTLNSSPSTAMPSPLASTFACRLPSTESYFSRCASVCGVGQIVDRDEIDVLVAERRAHDVAADAPESVDADLDSHRDPPVTLRQAQWIENSGSQTDKRFISTISRRTCISLYSLLTLVVFVVVSPYFVYQAIRYKKYIGSLRQRLGYLPISFNVDGEESIWIHAVSVGEALTARALVADLKARYPRLRLFLSTTTIAGQQVARQNLSARRRRVLFPVRLDLHRPPHARAREAAALHHDGDRDLAEPAARVPRAAASRR